MINVRLASSLHAAPFLVLWAVCGLAAAPVAAQDTSGQSAVALASAESSQLTRLAETGRFGDLLTRLRGLHDQAPPSPLAASLIEDLERWEANEQQRLEARRTAYAEKLEQVQIEHDGGKVEDGLVAAIEAYSLTDESQSLFKAPAVIDLVSAARTKAEAAEAERDWVTAASVYRLLNLLYESDGTYRSDFERVGRHLRVLGLYAPDHLDELYARYAAARGNDPIEDDHVVDEHWTERLDGVERRMLIQAVSWAAQRHVDHGGYQPLMRGAVESIRVLINTQGLDDTFPSLRDQDKTRRFREYLDRTLAQLDDPDDKVSRLDAEAIVDRVLAMNEATVQLPEAVMIYEMGEGATDQLDDFSGIIWPKDLEQFSRSTQGAFFGVGIQISRRDGRLMVVSPLENTPAQKAGLKAGDIITAVNGRNAANWSLNRAVAEITGPEGTDVTLTVERGAAEHEFKLTRARIVIESIRGWQHRPQADGGGWDYWIDRDAHIGYVRLSQFIPQSADDLDAAVQELQTEAKADGDQLRALILDLRFNPGGLLESAIDVADRFIESGPIVKTVDGQGEVTNTEAARRFGTYDDFPVVVLVNQGSASASEIVAGALQDYGRALIVGTRSFGKGSVQDLFSLSNHRARLKLTRQYYMLPLGRIIHRKDGAPNWGIEPNLVVSMTDQQVADALELRQEVDVLREDGELNGQADAAQAQDILTEGVDPQLESSLLILKTQQVAAQLSGPGIAGNLDERQARGDAPEK